MVAAVCCLLQVLFGRIGSPTREAPGIGRCPPKRNRPYGKRVSRMTHVCRFVSLLFASGWFVSFSCSAALAQAPSARFQLSDSIYLDEADSAARRHLEQVKTFVDAGQWDEAIETLRQVAENHGDKMIPLTQQRYVNLRTYVQLQLISLPPDALALYRSRVDSQARHWFEEGVAERDAGRLWQVVEQAFASSWTDQALNALGEIALEEANYARARWCWETIIPVSVRQEEGEVYQPEAIELACPDTDLDLAVVRARLILVSIFEGDRRRAAADLQRFDQLYPSATGRLGGRAVRLGEMLASLLEASRDWPRLDRDPRWATFAGDMDRTKVLDDSIDVGAIQWRVPLDKTVAAEATTTMNYNFRPRRVAEDHQQLLSYHPLVLDDLVLVNSEDRIRAYDVATGLPAWGQESAVIFDGDEGRSRPFATSHRYLGAPRFTMTAHDGKLLARMGSPVTSMANDFGSRAMLGYLVCLDLEAQGRLLWKLVPDEEKWSFEGTPVCDGANVYVAMRRSDVRPQAHVACYDLATGRQRWRRFICAAETPGRGQINEITSSLLTLHHDRLYFNTNLGAVASLSAEDGRVRWITLYPRAESGNLNDPAAHFYRDLNPCVYYRGKLLVAPTDSRHIFALDAEAGHLLWDTPHPEDAVHLLGVGSGNLVASGDRLWCIDVETGKLIGRWPEDPSLRGYGRGMLVGEQIYWPTRREIYVCSQRTGLPERIVPLTTKAPDVNGGNLLLAGDRLLVAMSDGLVVFGTDSFVPASVGDSDQPVERPPTEADLDEDEGAAD